MGYATIRAEVVDGVAALTLARPDRGNAIDVELARELSDVTTAWSVDPAVRVVLLRGDGRTFCVGGDLKAFAAQPDLAAHLTEVTTYLHAAMSRLARLDAPVVAAVQGSAAGAGFSLAAAADLLLAAESSRFVMAYTAIGLTPDGSGSWSLPRHVGLRRALDLALTNRPYGAAEALADGLVTRVVPDDELDAEAETLARTLAAGPTGALGATKRLLRDSLAHGLEEQLALEAHSMGRAGRSVDGREGMAAFLEKRPPGYTGAERW